MYSTQPGMSGEIELEQLLEQVNEAVYQDAPMNRGSSAYVRWVQSSLNQVLGTRLAIDGIMGPRTRGAIRTFQQRYGLRVDGIAGPQTERALIAARAGRPPQPTPVPPPAPSGGATLANLGLFSRNIIDQIRAAGQAFDCADLAIEIWIRFGERYNLPVSFRMWDSGSRRYTTVRRSSFRSADAFAKYVQRNLGARGLIGNTYEIAGGHRVAVPGDVYLWEYTHKLTGRPHRWGHTQIFYNVQRSSGGPANDQITIVQGDLPAIVPVFRTVPADYFNRPRQVNLRMNGHREAHIGLVVGGGPRRFNGFQNLR